MKLRRACATAISATLLTTGVGAVLAAPAFASGSSCHDENDFDSCAAINGSGDIINWGQASATSDAEVTTDDGSVVVDAHVELVGPAGNELCNSNTYAISRAGISMSCTWNAGGLEYRTGSYCAKVWEYLYIVNQYDWQWVEAGTPICVNVT